ncbi:phosphatase PAP2 family protein [Xanthobacter sp.]|uniref:phosphatase PAP2 family protein n=1 Tax=Xanthobacter sp. TaxID=35809 RepID=UPI0025EF40AC|nr:phosphatase PAP2 family protein [Xanthobacter sp.]
MSEDDRTGAARSGTLTSVLRGAGEGVRLLLLSIWRGLVYVRDRRIGVQRPRLGFLGPWEALALAALAAGIVAALMLLVDPITIGLRLKAPSWLVVFSDRLTDLGFSGVVLWPLGIGLAYALMLTHAGDEMTRRIAASVAARLGFLFLAIAPVGLLVAIVKHSLGRARPHAAMHIKGPSPEMTFDFLIWKSSFASFPSGHATTTFAAAVAFAALFPRARTILLVAAFPIAATRIVLSSHYPSDVVAGAVLGTVAALWTVKLFAARRVVFAVDATGTIVPMAGPSARRLARLLAPVASVKAGSPLLPPRDASTAVPAEEARP